ncbi:hypothetical protein, partial [Klebsiella pneumoniae]|uniref:hypothetical protein n=1 Tax=Klebsiella pneumoniae TaxID=573 RepID=UPI003B59F4AA
MPDLMFKHCSLSVYEKSEFAALSWSKNAACHASCPRFIPKQKNRSGARFATWLNGAVFLAMIPQSVSVFVLEPGYTKPGNWDPS